MKRNYTYNISTTLAGMVFTLANAYSQTDTVNAYEGMSLKDLLNIRIVSVSKSSESLFEAPLSASVVTKQDIQIAGCTSIMEALRLVPGMIVRETTNGNFDVQLRGVYTTHNQYFDATSGTTLVMIDNRPIFNYLKGGTFWETLPVDLNDVEKIEVVRGPAGALYGPNAVNGVINIITRQAGKDGFFAIANSTRGNYHTNINNASIGYRSGKWSTILSGNYQRRERTELEYYEHFRNQWITNPSILIDALGDTTHDVNGMYPKQNMAMEKYAGNVFLNYDRDEHNYAHFSAGIQYSFVQAVGAETGQTPYTTSSSDSRYADLRAGFEGFTTQLSFINGIQVADYQPGNKYRFNTFDATVGYNFVKGNFSLKPGLSYRSAIYDDTKYSDIINKSGIFNARGEITTKSASLRGEYKMLNKKLRLVAALASNTFNYPDTTYLAYELAATYKLHKKHLIRAVYSETPRSASIYDTYVDQDVYKVPIGYQKYYFLRLEGNKHIHLLTSKMFEIGYRGYIGKDITVDIELFDVRTKNYSANVINAPYVKLQGSDTMIIVPVNATNLPATGRQRGATVSVTYNNKKWQVKPFVTLQRSVLKDYAPFNNTPDAIPTSIQTNPAANNIYSGIGTESVLKSAPAVFGGASANYQVNSKLNCNLNMYYYSAQNMQHAVNIIFNDCVRGLASVPAKLILNASVSYEPIKGLCVEVCAKNLLNNNSREFFWTDEVPFRILGGIHYQL